MHILEESAIKNTSDTATTLQITIPATEPIFQGTLVDLGKEMEKIKPLETTKQLNPKLFREEYPLSWEIRLFEDYFKATLKSNTQTLILGNSCKENCEAIKNFYLSLGYFSAQKNAFEVDFKNCPIFLGTHIRYLVWSTKDCQKEKLKTKFIAPPREPGNQKALKNHINAGVISALSLYGDETLDTQYLEQLLQEEKISPIKLGRIVYFNYKKMGCALDSQEITLQLNLPEGIH